MATDTLIPEAVLNGYRQLLAEAGHSHLPLAISLRSQRPAFVLSGDVQALESYTNVPTEYSGILVVRRLLEDLTAAEAVVLCNTLKRLRRGDYVTEDETCRSLTPSQ